VTRQRAFAPSAWNLTGARVAEIPVMVPIESLTRANSPCTESDNNDYDN
jgi:hypothetical protein